MHRYILAPYKSSGTNRFTCPHCGKRKCFTPYLDTQTGNYIDAERCGKCDHESSCGYHLPPREYFKSQPSFVNSQQSPPNRQPSYRSACPTLSSERIINRQPSTINHPPLFLPHSLVNQSHSTDSEFLTFLLHRFPNKKDEILQAHEQYQLGATRSHGVIFWQIDHQNHVRTGKVMHYLPDGHRRQGGLYFIHSSLKTQGLIPADRPIVQCLFGEHLLPTRPDATVCIVESEKTAIICAIHYPQFVWLATGGCQQLSPEKLAPLRHRSLIIYPDSGELEKWSSVMLRTQDFNYRIVKDLEQFPHNTDIADLILQEATLSPQDR